MNILWFYSCEDPDSLQGFRRIQATEPGHPYLSGWWPPGHIIGYASTFVHVLYDLMKAIAEDKMPSPNFKDGLECQRIMEAVERSAQQQKWIEIDNIN